MVPTWAIEPGGHRFHALSDDGVSENCCCGRSVTRLIAGLLRDLADHLGAHILELVGELDLLGDGDPVLGDARRAERLVEDDVAALGTERHPHRMSKNVNAAQHPVAGIGLELNFFCCHDSFTPLSGFPLGRARFEHTHDVRLFHDDEVFAVDLDLRAGPFAE
jgi:hypothetical protein